MYLSLPAPRAGVWEKKEGKLPVCHSVFKKLCFHYYFDLTDVIMHNEMLAEMLKGASLPF